MSIRSDGVKVKVAKQHAFFFGTVGSVCKYKYSYFFSTSALDRGGGR